MEYPLTEEDVSLVSKGQEDTKRVLKGDDKRLLVVVGPCSIHDSDIALEYAEKLAKVAKKLEDRLLIVMRVYFEKPRTTLGWQGFVNDPHLDGSNDIETGLRLSRKLLRSINRLHLPVAVEALDIVTPPFIQDLVSYTAIGARTVESQSHRKMASGLTSTVGFKNATSGDVKLAINAIISAAQAHNFISINPEGQVANIRTKGNTNCHIILRGGKEPNYTTEHIREYETMLEKSGLPKSMIVDCSHGNSQKQHKNQIAVCHDLISQIQQGNQSIRGIMLESNLREGNQALKNASELTYGVSITDSCLGWEDTEKLLTELYEGIAQ